MDSIVIRIRERIAVLMTDSSIVNGNSDYVIVFDFDAEWSEFTEKTARFVYRDKQGAEHWTDVAFTGNSCNVPILTRVDEVAVGVYAGNIRTSTPALIPCEWCITDKPAEPYTPQRDYFNELMEQVNAILRKR